MAFSRRGLMGRILGKRPFRRGCLAIQVVIEAGNDVEMRRRFHKHIDESPNETPAHKRKFYKGMTSLLREQQHLFEYASYSYEDDERKADEEFRDWVGELEANMATEAIEVGDEIDGMNRMSADKKYIVVSMVFLLTSPHPWGIDLNDEDEDSYTRTYLGDLIDSVNLLDFDQGLEGDAIFLLPGSDEDGLSFSDITTEGWEHLHLLASG